MLNLDKKLLKREEDGKVIRVGIVGAGQMGRGMVTQMVLMKGIMPAIVSDIKIENAVHAFKYAEVSDEDIVQAKTLEEANAAMEAGKYVACEDANFVSQANLVECVIDATGVPDVGAKVATDAMRNKKHVIMLNVETDVVIGRKPGMTREELIGVNAGIVKSVTENVLKYSPNAIILCVANPMDTMTYLIHKISGLPKNRIIGMGGALDSARFKYYLSLALEANATEVEGIVIGGHGDTTMIPLKRFAAYRGIPASSLIPAEQLDKVAADTMVGGATLTSLLGTSAWIAPGAAAAQCVAAVLGDQKRLISCSALLEGEYGEKDLCIGVPCILGRDGIEKIVDFNLNDEELALFHKSAEAVHKTNAALPC